MLPLNLVKKEFSTYWWKQLRSLVIARYDWLWNPVPLFRAMRMKKGTHPVLLHANIFFPRFDENRWLVLLFLFFRARFDRGRFELWLAGSFFYTYCVVFYCLSVSFIDQSECFCSWEGVCFVLHLICFFPYLFCGFISKNGRSTSDVWIS